MAPSRRTPQSSQGDVPDIARVIEEMVATMTRDFKNIHTRGYSRIKPAMDKKWILKMDTRYPWVRVFLIPAC